MKLSDQMRVVRDRTARGAGRGPRPAGHPERTRMPASDKSLLASEQRTFEPLKEEKKGLDRDLREMNDRLEELLEEEAREVRAVSRRKLFGAPGAVAAPTCSQRRVYRDPAVSISSLP